VITMQSQLATARNKLGSLQATGDQLAQEYGEIRDECEDDGREPTRAEAKRQRQIKAEVRELAERMAEARRVVREVEKAENDEAEFTRRASTVTPTGAATTYHGREASMIGYASTRQREEYSAERDRRGERSYFADLFNAELGDVSARQRMQQFQAEERALSTGSLAGLIVPQYLTEQAALVARAGRPFANTIQSLQIPEQGTQFQVPVASVGASAAVQSSENISVSSTDEVWANATLPVATVAGQADVSRQSLERGVPGLDSLILSDLAAAYSVAVDQQCLSGSGASGQVLGVIGTSGINVTTAFTAAATASTFYSKIAQAIQLITTNRFLPPDHVAMHPRRWAWLLSQVDTAGRPLVVPSQNGPLNAQAVNSGPDYGSSVGQFMGMSVVVDANLPVAVGSGPEDQVLIYRGNDLLVWEAGGGMPQDLRFEQTLGNQLTVKLVAYGYIAFTAARYPKSVALMGGNAAAGFGLITPTL
jgi:HK97 family phage major capsid protein